MTSLPLSSSLSFEPIDEKAEADEEPENNDDKDVGDPDAKVEPGNAGLEGPVLTDEECLRNSGNRMEVMVVGSRSHAVHSLCAA